MRKADEIADPQSCLNRSAADEPVFVLCARDQSAPGIVQRWMTQAARDGVNADKLAGAERLRLEMLEWQAAHRVKVAD